MDVDSALFTTHGITPFNGAALLAERSPQMAKTACEEAVLVIEQGIGGLEFAKRLRAEGRELLMYRKLAHDISYGADKRRIAATLALQVMASGLQKARKK